MISTDIGGATGGNSSSHGFLDSTPIIPDDLSLTPFAARLAHLRFWAI